MTILRTDKIAGLESVNAITGSVFFGNNGFDSTTAKNKNFLLTEDGNSDLSLGTSDFTVEGWFWTSRADDLTQDYQVVIADSQYSNNYSWSFYIYQDEIKLWTCTTSCSALITGGSISSNTWHHFAWTRTGGTSRVFIDGSSIGSAADTTNYSDDRIMIGANKWSEAKPYGNYGITSGYISNIRIIKGKAIYGGAFTPPTRQLEVTPETVLLCCQSSQDPTKEETGKLLEAHKVGDAPGPLPSTFVPDVGNDHTHGTVLEGNVEFPSLNYMTLPRGTTTQSNRGRGLHNTGYSGGEYNSIVYVNIQSMGNSIDFGDMTENVYSNVGGGNGIRGIFAGGYSGNNSPDTDLNIIDYVTFATTGNATTFGDTNNNIRYPAAVSNSTRMLICGGGAPRINTIEYITIATTSNATDWGDLIGSDNGKRGSFCNSVMSPTRGIVCGGNDSTGAQVKNMTYMTIATLGSATDFGDLLTDANGSSGGNCSSNIRGVIQLGMTSPNRVNTLEYVTIASTGDAKDFGDLTQAKNATSPCSNSTRGVFFGGGLAPNGTTTNTIDAVTIATTGNAYDFGDIVQVWGGSNTGTQLGSATSDSHGGIA